uniref:Uncharacterized protein n=1 Tax=Lactuca sativa TaxID=4236 RepID=A0A9R1XY75_LACSA|nr:hypothetical protein LSAT_V11C100018510 [Lactuca sativa]
MLDEAARHLYISLCRHLLMSPTFPIGYIFCPVELKAKGFCRAALFFDIKDFQIHIHLETRWFFQTMMIYLIPQLTQTTCAISELFLHGRQVPGLFQHNNRIQPLSNGGGMWKLPDGVVPAECNTH